jgi:hypothetical protein
MSHTRRHTPRTSKETGSAQIWVSFGVAAVLATGTITAAVISTGNHESGAVAPPPFACVVVRALP